MLKDPPFRLAEEAFNKGVASRKLIFMVGKCRVEYKGRAKSKLELGERLLIVKKDGALLVHRPVGYLPVNWQPPECILQASSNEEGVTVRALRKSVREEVKILFKEVKLMGVLDLSDEGEFTIHASEEDMRDAIILNPELIEEGFKVVDFEKKVEPGFVDIYGVDKLGNLTVIEIKRGTAGREAVTQLMKYVNSLKKLSSRNLRAIIAAPKLAKGVRALMEAFNVEFKRLDPKVCALILEGKGNKKEASLKEWL